MTAAPPPSLGEGRGGGKAVANAPIGVFDSGIGGLSILRALRQRLPHERFVYYADTAHAPYGERDGSFVAERCAFISRQLLEEHGIKALVVACNTATAAAIQLLRDRHAGLPIIGVEPALKPAVLHTRTRRIAVLATRGTLASAKFKALHASLQGHAEFVLQPCDGLAACIEAGDDERIAALVARHVSAAGEYGTTPGKIDTVVLGCTHYPLALPHSEARTGPGVRLIEPGEAVATRTHRVLECRAALRHADHGGVAYLASGPVGLLEDAARRWAFPPP